MCISVRPPYNHSYKSLLGPHSPVPDVVIVGGRLVELVTVMLVVIAAARVATFVVLVVLAVVVVVVGVIELQVVGDARWLQWRCYW